MANILIIDDNVDTVELSAELLESAGHRVRTGYDGADGLKALAAGPLPDCVLLDVDMPVLSGDEMVRCIRLARPDLRVLYVTGHIDRWMDARPLWEGEAFLEKPFSGAGLREAVSLLLHGTIGRRGVGVN